jgi:hypothetical protein
VGGLPVTCNLTLPVACVARRQRPTPGALPRGFEYSKYNGWPEVKESLMTGRIQAAYMLAPLVMDLADKRIPVKIVSLGHRSGAVIMVRTDSTYKKFADLKGKRIAILSASRSTSCSCAKCWRVKKCRPRILRSSRWRRLTCRPRCTPRRSTATVPASRSAPPRSAPATPARWP